MYAVRVGGLTVEVHYLVTYLVGTCDDDTSIAEDEYVTHRKVLQATVAFL